MTAPLSMTEQPRVIVTRPMLGIFHMQVCAVAEATDAEILAVANQENLAGTEAGWCRVIRIPINESDGKIVPVRCDKYPDRLHFVLVC